MRVEILEVANGWVVRPAYDVTTDQGGLQTPMYDSHVFSCFEDLMSHLRSRSRLLRKDRDVTKQPGPLKVGYDASSV